MNYARCVDCGYVMTCGAPTKPVSRICLGCSDMRFHLFVPMTLFEARMRQAKEKASERKK